MAKKALHVSHWQLHEFGRYQEKTGGGANPPVWRVLIIRVHCRLAHFAIHTLRCVCCFWSGSVSEGASFRPRLVDSVLLSCCPHNTIKGPISGTPKFYSIICWTDHIYTGFFLWTGVAVTEIITSFLLMLSHPLRHLNDTSLNTFACGSSVSGPLLTDYCTGSTGGGGGANAVSQGGATRDQLWGGYIVR